MNPRYPVFIPSKGRYDSRLTVKSFDRIGVPYRVVVQPRERALYANVIDPAKLLLLPDGLDGLVPTRNWIWDYACERGFPRFWTFDDNVNGFFRFNHNLKVPVADGTIFRCVEDWTDRYENVVISGLNYFMFASRKCGRIPPLTLNTRVYSNMLIDTYAKDVDGSPLRNRGVFNDDTDLCLRVLKSGRCVALFNAFLMCKATTMTVSGGMTPLYQGDGRWKMAEELRVAHPDVTTVTRKWGRWQHHVNYGPFRRNRLRLRPGATWSPGVNNYGMTLRKAATGEEFETGEDAGEPSSV